MQTTLLGLAIAIILALVSALVAPLVVDWNHYRSGLRGGSQPPDRLERARERDDRRAHSADPAHQAAQRRSRRRRAASRNCAPARSSLKSGLVRCCAARCGPRKFISSRRRSVSGLTAPARSTGRPCRRRLIQRRFRSPGSTSRTGGSFSPMRRRARGVVLQKLWFNGDIRSFVGPFKGEGAFVAGDELYGYRISGNRAESGGGLKIRFGVDPSDHPLTTDIDGTLTLDHGVPQFEGTLALARPVGAALASGQRVMSEPWHAGGKLQATPASASLQDFALAVRAGRTGGQFQWQSGPDLRRASASRWHGLGAAGGCRSRARGPGRDAPAAARRDQEISSKPS